MKTLRLLPLLVAFACGSSSTTTSDAGPYDHLPPPDAAVASGLEPETWSAHLSDELLPFWRMAEARGVPEGNFPTYRGMDGSIQGSSFRKPRMMGRQVFTYCIGFMMTGDEELLSLARAGTRWLLDHARDEGRGGWFADLDATGAPSGDAAKFAQDASYAVMGPAAYFFVTRDVEAEAAVLETRDLLFTTYWDAAGGRIKDGMDGALAVETYMTAQGSWELVAQLDPITAFLLLVQPVLSEPARREQVLGDLRTLALRIHDSFWRDGTFWGTTGGIGSYGSRHTDFGHILKAYWALLQIDKRLDDHPLRAFLDENLEPALELALDDELGRWANRPLSTTEVAYGSDWWAYAEADQLAATVSMRDPSWIARLAETSTKFRTDFVDRTRPARELVPSISRGGVWVRNWSNSDTAKANEWKNGFHGAEHALVLYLFSHWLADRPAPLYFALPADRAQALAAESHPYTFLGRVATVEDLRPLAADPSRRVVRITFDQLR